MQDLSAIQIALALETFLSGSGVKRVYIAGGTIPPPPLAYLVGFARLSLVLSGDDDMEIEQHGKACLFRVKQGDAVFVPANSWNKSAWARRVKVLTLLFGKHYTGVSLAWVEQAAETASAIKLQLPRPLDGPVPPSLEALEALAANYPRAPIDRLLVQAVLHLHLNILKDPSGRSGGKADKTFQKLCLYVQENSHCPLTRDSLAHHFCLSPNHVSRLFRTEGLMKFVDYLALVRLERAKYLLRLHDRALIEIASCCGFNSVGYFCKVFKKAMKQTPTEYRLQARSGLQ